MGDDENAPADEVSSTTPEEAKEEQPPFVYIFTENSIQNLLEPTVGNFEWIELQATPNVPREYEISFSSPHANVAFHFSTDEMLQIAFYLSTFLLTYSLISYLLKWE